MLELFKKSFVRDETLSVQRQGVLLPVAVPGWNELVDRLSGDSFDRGLYRVIRASDAADWNRGWTIIKALLMRMVR